MSKKLIPYLLILPSLAIVVFFVIYPIINSIMRSFQHPDTGSFTLENYGFFMTAPMQLENIFFIQYSFHLRPLCSLSLLRIHCLFIYALVLQRLVSGCFN